MGRPRDSRQTVSGFDPGADLGCLRANFPRQPCLTPNGLASPSQQKIIDRLNGAAVEALADPTARSRLVQLGMEIFPREQQTPQALGSLQKADAEKWWPLIKAANIRRE